MFGFIWSYWDEDDCMAVEDKMFFFTKEEMLSFADQTIALSKDYTGFTYDYLVVVSREEIENYY